jgi:hypothetical protein
MVRSRHIVIAALLAAAGAAPVDRPATAQSKAHHHGAASLQVGLDGQTLQIALESPSDNLLGFEHAPRTEAQRKAVARAEEQLRQPGQLFVPEAAAGCQPGPVRVELKLPAAGSSETHSEVEAEWRWECARADALTHVDVGGLFKSFPRLKQLTVQVVTPRGQRAAVLKPGASRLRIAS